jgi:hypothetical protein
MRVAQLSRSHHHGSLHSLSLQSIQRDIVDRLSADFTIRQNEQGSFFSDFAML